MSARKRLLMRRAGIGTVGALTAIAAFADWGWRAALLTPCGMLMGWLWMVPEDPRAVPSPLTDAEAES